MGESVRLEVCMGVGVDETCNSEQLNCDLWPPESYLRSHKLCFSNYAALSQL